MYNQFKAIAGWQTPARLLSAGAAVVFATGLAGAPGGAAAQEQLVISHWGFNGDKLEEFLFAPFEEEHGVEIIVETGNNADRLSKVQVRGGEQVDVIYLASGYAQAAIEEGLFAEIDRSRIPNIDQIYDVAQAPHGEAYGPAYTIGRYGIIYDAAAVDEPIDSWEDLWNPAFEGRASIPDLNTTAGALLVIYAAERRDADAFVDPETAFESLAELTPNIVTTYNRSSALANMFAQGEVVVAAAQDFIFPRIKEAVPTAEWAELEEGAFANLNTINIVKGSDQIELAHEFINWALSQEAQRALAINQVDAPVNTTVDLTPEEAAIWTYGADVIASLQTADEAAVSAAMGDWTDRWNQTFRQ